MRRLSMGTLLAVVFAFQASAADLPLGELEHDGPPTPEQISMYMKVTGELPQEAVGSVRFKLADAKDWTTAHPLHRIRPADTAQKVEDAYAGVITGLEPGKAYEVEVTVTNGADSAVKTLKATTRALPPAAGAATKTIAAGTATAEIQAALDAAQPGDVIQFANGTYEAGRLQIKKGGSVEKPVYIRGESRGGVVLKNPSGSLFQVLECDNVVVENLTMEGSGTDSGTKSSSQFVSFWSGAKKSQENFTFRNVTVKGVDQGIVATKGIRGALVYDNSMQGNNTWTAELIQTNSTWNDDGIRVPGQGNAVFNNTMIGFGDTMAVNSGNVNAGVHFYRNEILMTGDDSFESDYGTRNMTFYDNRIQNSATFLSCDPIYGGPLYVFRNISINAGRGPYKLNNKNTGFYIYNNTLVRTNGWGSGKDWPWVQFNNGPLVAWAYRNNILVFKGKPGKMMAVESGGMNPVDFDHNAWYPDGAFWWSSSGGSAGSLDAVRAKLPETKALFSGITKRHTADLICEANPFEEDVVLGEDHLKQITKLYTPKLKADSTLRGKGVAIPGVTDGFTGEAPDMGAIITGRPVPQFGDRSKDAPKLGAAEQ
ncbi:MAG: hypothetical protein L6R28_07390 [Planctomycetes bacterium]|nr:hypothetical protein [Planctomycetota bacterium]